MGKVIRAFIREKTDAEHILEDILKELSNDNVTDFIVAARRKLTPDEIDLPENEDAESITIQHWYSEISSVHALGLASRILHLINCYIDYTQMDDDCDE